MKKKKFPNWHIAQFRWILILVVVFKVTLCLYFIIFHYDRQEMNGGVSSNESKFCWEILLKWNFQKMMPTNILDLVCILVAVWILILCSHLLPTTDEARGKLCFHSCVWFCWQRGGGRCPLPLPGQIGRGPTLSPVPPTPFSRLGWAETLLLPPLPHPRPSPSPGQVGRWPPLLPLPGYDQSWIINVRNRDWGLVMLMRVLSCFTRRLNLTICFWDISPYLVTWKGFTFSYLPLCCLSYWRGDISWDSECQEAKQGMFLVQEANCRFSVSYRRKNLW